MWGRKTHFYTNSFLTLYPHGATHCQPHPHVCWHCFVSASPPNYLLWHLPCLTAPLETSGAPAMGALSLGWKELCELFHRSTCKSCHKLIWQSICLLLKPVTTTNNQGHPKASSARARWAARHWVHQVMEACLGTASPEPSCCQGGKIIQQTKKDSL